MLYFKLIIKSSNTITGRSHSIGVINFTTQDFNRLMQLRPFYFDIDPFTKRHRLVHNGGFPKFEALYCSLNMVNSVEFS